MSIFFITKNMQAGLTDLYSWINTITGIKGKHLKLKKKIK